MPLRSQPPQSRAEMLLLQLLPADRQSFEAYYEQRLQEALGTARTTEPTTGGVDHDRVEGVLLATLIAEAEGTNDPDGFGCVPVGSQIYDLIPPTRDPRLPVSPTAVPGEHPPQSERMMAGRWIAAGALLLLGIGLLLWSQHPARTTSSSPVPPPAAVVEAVIKQLPTPPATAGATSTSIPLTPTPFPEQAAEPARLAGNTPISLEITQPNGEVAIWHIVPSSGSMGGVWQPPLDAGTAAWLQGTSINTVLCLPQAAAGVFTDTLRGQLLTVRSAAGTVAEYSVLRLLRVGRQQTEVIDQRRAGLTLVLCGSGPPDQPNQRTVAEAVFHPDPRAGAAPESSSAVGLVDLLSVRITNVQVLTPTAELAHEQALALVSTEVENRQAGTLPLGDFAATLELGDQIIAPVPGTALSAALGGHERRLIAFRYLVPRAGGTATWHLLAPTGEATAIPVTVPAAPADTRLQVTLEPGTIHLLEGPGGKQLLLPLTVRNPTALPLALDPGAFTVYDGSTVLPSVTPLSATVSPGAVRTILLATAAPVGKLVIVHYGAHHWHVQLP